MGDFGFSFFRGRKGWMLIAHDVYMFVNIVKLLGIWRIV